jgi:hypothetical protein
LETHDFNKEEGGVDDDIMVFFRLPKPVVFVPKKKVSVLVLGIEEVTKQRNKQIIKNKK